MIQIILVIIVIASSLAYLGWQIYRKFFRKESGCDGCSMSKAQKE